MLKDARLRVSTKRRLMKAEFALIMIFTLSLAFYLYGAPVLAHTPSPAECNDAICNVDLRDNTFQPASLSIMEPSAVSGQTVTIVWQNHGLLTHTVTSGQRNAPDGIFDRTLSPGQSFQLVIDQNLYSQILARYPNGVIPYYCSLHFGMDATLTIRASTPPQPTLSVTATADPSVLNSSETSIVTVQVTSSGTPVSGATVTLTASNDAALAQASGTTDVNGYFTTTLTAPTVTTQTSVTVTTSASRTGYNDGSGQVIVTVNPSESGNPSPPENSPVNTSLWIYLAVLLIALSAIVSSVAILKRKRRQ